MLFSDNATKAQNLDQGVHGDRATLPFPKGGVWSLQPTQAHRGRSTPTPADAPPDDAALLAAIESAQAHLTELSAELDAQSHNQLEQLRLRAADTHTQHEGDGPPRAA